ncbi:transcriptional repressor, partial [Enterospora canceri]
MSKEKSDTKTSLQSLQEMKKTRFPLSRIKKIIQEDEDVGKTSSTVPVALSKVCEVFIEEVATRVKTGKKVSKK